MKIYRFPPAKLLSSAWSVEDPTRRSRGVTSGDDLLSSAGPRRRLAVVTISALSGADRAGAGYSDALKSLLRGGEHLVELQSPAPNWYRDQPRPETISRDLAWVDGATGLQWQAGGAGLKWREVFYPRATAVQDNGFPALRIEGAPPGLVIARPNDPIAVYDGATKLASARALNVARSDALGVAVIRFNETLPSGELHIGERETAVFRATSMPFQMQPIDQNWGLEWKFREVLPHERPNAEVLNPW